MEKSKNSKEKDERGFISTSVSLISEIALLSLLIRVGFIILHTVANSLTGANNVNWNATASCMNKHYNLNLNGSMTHNLYMNNPPLKQGVSK